MKKNSSGGRKKLQGYRAMLGLGIGLSSIALSLPAHASIPNQGCSETPTASSAAANFSSVQVSQELAFLRQIDLSGDLGFGRKQLLTATCSGACNPDGSGSYTQEPGCTYTQTCGGGTKKPLQS